MKDFRYVRNFVSHVEFTGPTLAFIEKELGVGTDHYDPFNEAHRTLLRDWRQRAREVIRVELERNLGL
jgi:hypothetical protein